MAVCSASVIIPAHRKAATIAFLQLPQPAGLAEETANALPGAAPIDLTNTTAVTHGCVHGQAGAVESSKVTDGSVLVRFRDENAKGHFEWKLVGKSTKFTKSTDICQVDPGQYQLLIRSANKEWVLLANSFGKNGVSKTNQTIPVTAHTVTIVTIEHAHRTFVEQVAKPVTLTVPLPPPTPEVTNPVKAPPTEAPEDEEVVEAPSDGSTTVGSCTFKGPSRGIDSSGGKADGVLWPETYATAEKCAQRCEAVPSCAAFHWYGSKDVYNSAGASGFKACYMHKAGKMSPADLKDGRDRYAGECNRK